MRAGHRRWRRSDPRLTGHRRNRRHPDAALLPLLQGGSRGSPRGGGRAARWGALSRQSRGQVGRRRRRTGGGGVAGVDVGGWIGAGQTWAGCVGGRFARRVWETGVSCRGDFTNSAVGRARAAARWADLSPRTRSLCGATGRCRRAGWAPWRSQIPGARGAWGTHPRRSSRSGGRLPWGASPIWLPLSDTGPAARRPWGVIVRK